MNRSLSGVRTITLSALAAVLLTVVVSGAWAGLLSANLHLRPDLPWSALALLVLIAGLWWWLRGGLARSTSAKARRANLRDEPIPARVAVWAVLAGLLCLVCLISLWIILHQLNPEPSRPHPDYSKLSPLMTFASFTAAAVSGAISEEAGFRGYFQGALERYGFGPAAIVVAAALIAPLHALTQGFGWSTIAFYLCADVMFGALAYITKSIRPGIVVHGIGLFVFFTIVWPQDAQRRLVWRDGADSCFWINVCVMTAFAVVGVWALASLTVVVRTHRTLTAVAN